MDHTHTHATATTNWWLITVAAVVVIAAAASVWCYVAAARRRPWPVARTVAWCAGVAVSATGAIGSVAFTTGGLTGHMVAHVLVAMAGPALCAAAAPHALAVR